VRTEAPVMFTENHGGISCGSFGFDKSWEIWFFVKPHLVLGARSKRPLSEKSVSFLPDHAPALWSGEQEMRHRISAETLGVEVLVSLIRLCYVPVDLDPLARLRFLSRWLCWRVSGQQHLDRRWTTCSIPISTSGVRFAGRSGGVASAFRQQHE